MKPNLIEQLPTIATIFFFIIFCFIVFTVFKKGSKKKMNNHAKIPLRDEGNRRDNNRNGRRSRNGNRFNRNRSNHSGNSKNYRGNNGQSGRGDRGSRESERNPSAYKGSRFIGNSSSNKNQAQSQEKSES